jgi:hypothetical protein
MEVFELPCKLFIAARGRARLDVAHVDAEGRPVQIDAIDQLAVGGVRLCGGTIGQITEGYEVKAWQRFLSASFCRRAGASQAQRQPGQDASECGV